MRYTTAQIATECHSVTRGLQEAQNDPTASPFWMNLHPDLREAALRGVERARLGATPANLHSLWVVNLRNAGWTLGPTRDYQKLTHPNLRPFQDLPQTEQHKTILFDIVVQFMAAQEWSM